MELTEMKYVCKKCKEEFEISSLDELIEYSDEYEISLDDIHDWGDTIYDCDIFCLPCLRKDAEGIERIEDGIEDGTDTLTTVIQDHMAETTEEVTGLTGLTTDTVVEDDYWTVEIKMLENCSEAPKSVPVIIKPLVKMKIDKLMVMFPSIEWLAYFIGNATNDKYVIEDILIPEQVVSAGSVSNVKFSVPIGKTVIGVGHSHHGMGSFFSGTDRDFINSNHNLSIVVSRNDMKGQVRWKAPCGGYKIVDTDIIVDLGIEWDIEQFEKDVDGKIKTWVYMYNNQPITYCNGNEIGRTHWKETFKPSKNRCNKGNKRPLPQQLRGQNGDSVKRVPVWHDPTLQEELGRDLGHTMV
jgi:hypothetical protein